MFAQRFPGPVPAATAADPSGQDTRSLAAALGRTVTEVGVLLRRWRREAGPLDGAEENRRFTERAEAAAHEELSTRLASLDSRIDVIGKEEPAAVEAAAAPGGRPHRYWLISPVDGAAGYARGLPGYATQAALIVEGRPEAAAVHAPEPSVLYTAVRRQGAFRDGRRLPRHAAAPPGYGVLTDGAPRPRGISRAVAERFGYTGYLESGGISLKLCTIAEGAAHLFVRDTPVWEWDVAAPGLLLSEAGGGLTRLDGTPFPHRGGFEHTGLVGAADPATGTAVAHWVRNAAAGPGTAHTVRS